jgi:hypothetical protein
MSRETRNCAATNALAVESVKQAAIERKFATNTMFSKLLLAADTAIDAVFAVSSVMVGRLSPSPRPIIRMPALVQDRPVVACEMDSAWPGRTTMVSPWLAVQSA